MWIFKKGKDKSSNMGVSDKQLYPLESLDNLKLPEDSGRPTVRIHKLQPNKNSQLEDWRGDPVKMLCWGVSVHGPGLSVCPQVTPLLHQQNPLLTNQMESLQHQALSRCSRSRPAWPSNRSLSADSASAWAWTLAFPQRSCLSGRWAGSWKSMGIWRNRRTLKAPPLRLQEFRQEPDLPEEVNSPTLSCYLCPDRKLHIKADTAPSVEEMPPNRKHSQEEAAVPRM